LQCFHRVALFKVTSFGIERCQEIGSVELFQSAMSLVVDRVLSRDLEVRLGRDSKPEESSLMRKSSKYAVAFGFAILSVFAAGRILNEDARAQVSAPTLNKLLPKFITAGSPTFSVRLQGTGFDPKAQVILDGNALPSSRVTRKGKIILAEVDASVVANPGSHSLLVRNPDGGATDSLTLPVIAPDPDLFLRLGGNAAQEGQPADLAISITGQGFTADSVVAVWGSATGTTVFVNDTELATTIPQDFLSDHARIPIIVSNPKGAASNTEVFFVVEEGPKIQTIDPDTIQAGSAAVLITVTGSRLTSAAVLVVNGEPLPDTQFLVKGSRLTGTIPAALLASPGELVVRIEQDNIQSVDQTIAVTPTAGPFIFRIGPSRFRVGEKKDSVTIFGANFVDGSRILVDGLERRVPTGATKRNIQLPLDKDVLSTLGPHTVQIQDADGKLSNVATFQVVPDVTVSSFAGKNNFGFSTQCVGPDTATFRGPRRITLGPDGLLYLTDQLNHAIRSVDPMGRICTVAGTGLPGYNDSGNSRGFPPAFADPNGLTVAPDGTIYVSENGNAVLRRIVKGADGTFSVDTFAGGWSPLTDKLRQDRLNSTKLGIDGLKDAPVAQALFRQPDDIVIAPDGTMYVSDASNAVIRRIRATPGGPTVDTIAGNGVPGFADGAGTSAFFNNPTGLALSPDSKFLYVADFNNFRIRRIDLSTFRVDTLAGSGDQGDIDGPPGDATFDQVFGLAVDSDGTIYVSEVGSGQIRRVDPDGNVNTLAGGRSSKLKDGPGSQATFSSPKGLAIDRTNGVLYLADFDHLTIRKIQLR
jgi:sugar lactone lactonase YvrE